ncbi:hypothetical protein [Methylobacterium isbiliense]|uniref:Uncharacterized protein n=1 Tax=Methylobacterium isbiliense TaxID=315478 RepID=A0ABQ4S869_9HYPH|nr:hypothetical protein [Methylobacterium isbiliense]MDN3626617.1 hypothetical protein [Methylobacterium isbiliense]GJD99281.1 hypothetical protein GMJLKIPL_1197 [Methylobacterium isbiliense]
MSHDEQLKDGQFRIAFRVAQSVNAKTGWAEISDDALMDEVLRTEEKKLRTCRRDLERLGWWRTIEGERGRPTLCFGVQL